MNTVVLEEKAFEILPQVLLGFPSIMNKTLPGVMSLNC